MKQINIFENGKQIATVNAKTRKEGLNQYIKGLFLNKHLAPIVNSHQTIMGGIKYAASFVK